MMKVEVEKQEKNTATIQLEIPSEQASQEYNKAWRRLGQRLNIPGFRRGKAPRNMVEKTVGVDRIKQEALDRLLPHAFADAISEHQLDIVSPPEIKTYKFEMNEGISVSAVVELRPEVGLGKMEGLKLDVPEFKMPDDAEKRELDAVIERFSTLEPVIDREVKKNDTVNIDFTGYVKGEEIRGGAARNFRLDLSENNFIEGFADQIVGHKLSEEFQIKVTFPKDYHDKTLSGKPADFNIKINEISEKVVPTMDDDLAKKCGFDTIDKLKEEVKSVLANAVEQENTFRKQKALVEAIVEGAKVEIPESMVQRETNLLTDEVQQRLKQQNMTWERFVETEGKDQVMENLKNEAIKRIKTSLVFGAIAKQEGMTVTDDEFSEEVKNLAQARGVDEKNIMRHLGNNVEAAQGLSDQILSQKIVSYLIEKNEFKYVEDKQDDADDKKPAKGAKKGNAKKDEKAVAEAIEGEKFDTLDEEN